MVKLIGQALWVEENCEALLDKHAHWALGCVFDQLQQGKFCFEDHPDLLLGETIKAEALIGPPPCKEPYLTYAKWYRARLKRIEEDNDDQLLALHSVIRFARTDGTSVTFHFDALAQSIFEETGSQSGDITQILWIDIELVDENGHATSLVSKVA